MYFSSDNIKILSAILKIFGRKQKLQLSKVKCDFTTEHSFVITATAMLYGTNNAIKRSLMILA